MTGVVGAGHRLIDFTQMPNKLGLRISVSVESVAVIVVKLNNLRVMAGS
jgi:hypothetical protein